MLDLFAGTGSLGLESVSRGAAKAVFVERDARAVAHMRKTFEAFRISDRCSVARSDGVRFVTAPWHGREPFDIVFADPPYDTDQARRIYEALDCWDGVVADGLVVIEHRTGDRLPERGARLMLRTVKRYGTIEVELHDVADSGGTQ